MASIKGAEILRSGRLHRRGYTGTEIPTVRVSQKSRMSFLSRMCGNPDSYSNFRISYIEQ
jgi:hypothetical protein